MPRHLFFGDRARIGRDAGGKIGCEAWPRGTDEIHRAWKEENMAEDGGGFGAEPRR